jgi:hypothetical protein
MKAQTILALPLILCLALCSTARLSAAQEASGDATKITSEEAQEAREFAERFIRRMQETNDLAPLVDEMFVTDYAARLRQEAVNKSLPLLSKGVVEQASREEVARYQLALNNSVYLASLMLLAYKTLHPAAEDVEEEEGAAYYKQVLPPDIFELCRNDPVLKVLFEEETDGRAEESRTAAPTEKPVAEYDDGEPIRSVEQLRSFTATLEQAIVLARRHLAASPLKLNLLDRHKGANEEENWTGEREAMKPRAWTLTQEFYGYAEGTRIFCVDVLLYHMDLIRVEGKLKVVALYVDMD